MMAAAPVPSDTLISPILAFIKSHHSKQRVQPLIIGISGPQGSGKTTLVNHLVKRLPAQPYSLRVVSFSIDDIYLPHDELLEVSRSNLENKLLQHRGEPGTHDVALGISTIDSLLAQKATPIPSYDKSKYDGQGDRVPSSEWTTAQPPFDIILFEGWCLGFQAISAEAVAKKRSISGHWGILSQHALEHLQFVNEELRGYSCLWDRLEALIWLNAQDINFVYAWRLQQEHAMKAALGRGMTDEQVKIFVDGYMPAYEMYIGGLMKGELFAGKKGRQILRIDIDQDRNIVGMQKGEVSDVFSWKDL
jgi:D-glycerate 3-kinase